MASPELDREMSEPDRRKLVKRLAERGTATEEIAETTIAQTRDYSAAAEAAFQGDPVQLPQAAQEALSETVQAPAEAGAKYAAAQRSIFGAGQGRELAAGHQFLDDTKTTVEATSYALGEYDEQLAEDKAARAAAASSRRRTPSTSDFWRPTGDDTAEATREPVERLNRAQTWVQSHGTVVDPSSGPQGNADFDEAFNIMADAFMNDETIEEGAGDARDFLRSTGMGSRRLAEYYNTLYAMWEHQFRAPYASQSRRGGVQE